MRTFVWHHLYVCGKKQRDGKTLRMRTTKHQRGLSCLGRKVGCMEYMYERNIRAPDLIYIKNHSMKKKPIYIWYS